MNTEKPEEQKPSPPNAQAPLPEEWQKPRTETPEDSSGGSMLMKGCGGVVLVVLVLFGLLFGTCLLNM